MEENKEEQKRVLETIKNDKALHAHVMNMYYTGWMLSLIPLILSVYLIFINEIEERIGAGILGIVFSLMAMVSYYVSLIRPLKYNKTEKSKI